jgi:EAL domain-containing protein (putative c-di-GMP-specific phosphodiesterase class I)
MEYSSWDLWDEIDCLFIGGSTEWKLGPAAAELVAIANSLGKWVHMGRVNSERRYRYAEAIGCDSVDGTYLTYGPDKLLPIVQAWCRSSDQLALFAA